MKRAAGSFAVLFLLGGVVVYLWFTPGRTPRIHAPNGIASLERVRLGGADQYVLIRGTDVSHPVLLFLHGGPGMPAMYLTHAFQRELERDFIVVQWDRRGAGKSYDAGVGSTLDTEQLIADTVELTNRLRARFHQDKIFLVCHSWGTYLGMLVIARRPELYQAYVGIGQLARMAPIAAIQDEFIRQGAQRAGDNDALKELDEKGAAVREKLLFKFGGELHNATSFTPLLLTGLAAPEYSLRDVRNVPRGVALYSRSFVDNAVTGELMDSVTEVKVPIYFFTGRHDYCDPFTLTEEYFQNIKAPVKNMVWFQNSAHFPFYEEPAEFAEQMRMVLTSTKAN